MIKKLTGREQGLFVACIVLIGVYAGYHALVRPLREKMASAEREIHAYQTRLRKAVRDVRKSAEMGRQYREYLNRFKQVTTDEQVMASILSEVEEASGKFGLGISELQSKKVQHEEYYNTFSVSLIITSDLVNVLRFLHALQEPPHLFDLKEARFDKSPGRNAATIRATLILSKIFIP